MASCAFHWETQLVAETPYSFLSEDFDASDFLSDYEWTDISEDVRYPPNPTWSRGMSGGGPDDRVARVGVLSLALNNFPRNAPRKLGYYTPGHANARVGFGIGHGLRLRATYQELNRVLFMGTIETLAPTPGEYLSRHVDVVVTDWMEEAATSQIEGLSTLLDVRSDEVIAALVESMPRPPLGTDIRAGLDTYPYALDAARDQGGSIAQEFQKVAASEFGYVYVTAEGTLVFEGRSSRSHTATVNSYTFETELDDLVVRRSRGGIINKVKVTVHPRRSDETNVVLYQLSQTLTLAAGETVVMRVGFTDPEHGRRTGAVELQPVQPYTDYLANAVPNQFGQDMTTALIVTSEPDGNGATVRIVNGAGIPVYLLSLQIRGRGLYNFDPVVTSAENEASIERYGRRTRLFDMPYQPNPLIGLSAATYLLQIYDDEMQLVESLSFLANRSGSVLRQALTGEIGQRIGVRESVTAVTDDIVGSTVNRGWFINGVSAEIEHGKYLRMSYYLTPTDRQSYWLLGSAGSSELGVTTRLGFGLFN